MNSVGAIFKRLFESNTRIDYMRASDEELAELGKNNDKKAIDVLITRYEKLVRKIASGYFVKGGDNDDLTQEGLLGFVDAIKKFDAKKNKNFQQFAMLAVKRNIMDAVRSSTTKRNSPMSDYDSYDDLSLPSKRGNPEKSLLDKEAQQRIQNYLKNNLTDWERKVLGLYLQGYDYKQMAEKTGKDRRSVDNAMQKIRSKLRVYKDKFRDSKIISIVECILSDDQKKLKESLAYEYFFTEI